MHDYRITGTYGPNKTEFEHTVRKVRNGQHAFRHLRRDAVVARLYPNIHSDSLRAYRI